MSNSCHATHVPWWALCLCLAVCLAGIFDHDLWTPDEPRVAAISLEMSRTGNLVVPYLAGEPFLEKPPLYFAVAAGFIRILGPLVGNTGAIRLTSALWGLGALGMTFLLARRLTGHACALLSTAILATMWGFVENSHWIRVDAALAFFVAAAVWSFSEVYFAGRRWFCVLSGLFSVGAFLSKGLIGPVFIGVAWIGMVIPWVIRQRREKRELELFIFPHIISLLAFVSLAGSWIILLRVVGGQELWHEWFWENHVGRLLGTATGLSHMRAGQPFYYVRTLAMFGMPWVPVVLVWAGEIVRDLWKRRTVSAERVFLLVWGLGSILLLSLSVTKRGIYLAPVLPAFAIMCAEAFQKDLPRWCRAFFVFWLGLCVLVLAVLTASPLIARFLPQTVPANIVDFLGIFALGNLVSGVGLAACVYLLFQLGRIPVATCLAAATAMFYIGLFAVPAKAVDLEKSMKTEMLLFVARIPPARRPHVAGWKFSETMLGSFYYYCDWSVPRITDEKRLLGIITGQDREFDSVIVPCRESSILGLLKVPCRVIAEGYPGAAHHKRGILWVEGLKHIEKDAGETVGENDL
jgi:4-amino-4-deoxy-L-arabinose transferase-like glycosyltransferase